LWQEPDKLLIYFQIETKYFRPMIRQYFISLTPGPDPPARWRAGLGQGHKAKKDTFMLFSTLIS
jgi:hypothetical protein